MESGTLSLILYEKYNELFPNIFNLCEKDCYLLAKC